MTGKPLPSFFRLSSGACAFQAVFCRKERASKWVQSHRKGDNMPMNVQEGSEALFLLDGRV